ncbi:MAG: MT-A70 family methyltransferase, partial [Bacteroidales bacterium]
LRVRLSEEKYQEIYERYKKGETQQQLASEYKISRQRVAQIIELVESRKKVPEQVKGDIPFPDKKYRCIIIDPPWPVEKIEREVRPKQGNRLDYPVMTLEEISRIPIAKLVDKNGCHIYLWVTQKFLPAGLDLFKQLGVDYQCILTWVKPTGFTPYSWMYNTEHVLFGKVGNLKLLKLGIKLSFEAPSEKHSKKPGIFYSIVKQVSPEPRLDMFAREKRDGFDVWGNEI